MYTIVDIDIDAEDVRCNLDSKYVWRSVDGAQQKARRVLTYSVRSP